MTRNPIETTIQILHKFCFHLLDTKPTISVEWCSLRTLGLKSFKSMITVMLKTLILLHHNTIELTLWTTLLRTSSVFILLNSCSLSVSQFNWNVGYFAVLFENGESWLPNWEGGVIPKKEWAAEPQKAPGPVMIAPVRERLTALRTWLLTLLTGGAPPPPLYPVSRSVDFRISSADCDCQLSCGHRDHSRQTSGGSQEEYEEEDTVSWW